MQDVEMKELIESSNGILMLYGKLIRIGSVNTRYESKSRECGFGCIHLKELSGIKIEFVVESTIERYHLEFEGIILESSVGNQVQITVRDVYSDDNKLSREVTHIEDKTIGTRYSITD